MLIDETTPNRTILFSDDTPADTSVIRIPHTHLITSRTALTPLIQTILTHVKRDGVQERIPDAAGANAALLLFVIFQLANKDKSHFEKWLDTLPTHVHTPVTVNESRLHGLSETPLYPFVSGLRAEMHEMYHDWFLPYAVTPHPQHFPLDICTYTLFLHAHSLIESRAFKIDDIVALVPFADMINHASQNDPTCNARVRGWYETVHGEGDKLGVEIYVTRACARGEELKISYGSLSNVRLLTHWGFAVEANVDEEFPVSLEMPVEKELEKTLVLHAALGDDLLDFELSRESGFVSDRMLATARVLLLEEDEMKDAARRNFYVRVSERNERAVVKWLREILESYWVAEEEAEVEEVDDFDRFCTVYRMGLRQILEGGMERIDRLEKALDDGVRVGGNNSEENGL